MEKYTIQQAYPYNPESTEIEIESENLLYTELFDTHAGCQVANQCNKDEILNKCRKIANLIRDIEKLQDL